MSNTEISLETMTSSSKYPVLRLRRNCFSLTVEAILILVSGYANSDISRSFTSLNTSCFQSELIHFSDAVNRSVSMYSLLIPVISNYIFLFPSTASERLTSSGPRSSEKCLDFCSTSYLRLKPDRLQYPLQSSEKFLNLLLIINSVGARPEIVYIHE